MNKVLIRINNVDYQAEAGANLLAEATKLGVDIPHLCYDPRLKPFGSCRLCFVEVKGRPQPIPACSMTVTEELEIITESEQLSELRRMALELIMAEHCGDCFAPCQEACPASIDIQGFIAHMNNKNYALAGDLIRARMPLPSICGRVCPRFCEDDCRRNLVDHPVNICDLKRFAGDYWLEKLADTSPARLPDSGYRVAVVGGGPAGLSAGYYLALQGHNVTLYDAGPKLGGMLRYGIPEYRLPEDILDKEIGVITNLLEHVELGKRLGVDYTLEDLEAEDYDAIFLGVGCQQAQLTGLPNQDLPGVYSGIDFLRRVTNKEEIAIGERVAVVGGGNTAMDAARTAVRLGAKDVMVIYRRTQAEMPAEENEIVEAMEEGIQFNFLTNPSAFIGSDRVSAVECVKMELGAPDVSGRRRPVEVPGSEFELAVDSVILALGQKVDQQLIADLDIATTKWGSIYAGTGSGKCSIPGVFAAGDCVTGAATVVEAVGAARRVALEMDAFLRNIDPESQSQEIEFKVTKGKLADLDAEMFATKQRLERIPVTHQDPKVRKHDFKEYNPGLTKDQIGAEGQRCLECGCLDVHDCQLRILSERYGVTNDLFAPTEHRYTIDETHPNIVRDQNKCILCGKCVTACQELTGEAALGFSERGFETTVEPALKESLAEVCSGCGLCVTVCPTGALTMQFPWMVRGPWVSTKHQTTCVQCSLNCGLEFEVVDNRIVESSSPIDHLVSNGILCHKGSFNYQSVYENRLPTPLVRVAGELQESSWEQAVDLAAHKLLEIRDQYGVNSIAMTVSGQITNEEASLAKLISKSLKTDYLFSTSPHLRTVLGADPVELDAIAASDLIVTLNTQVIGNYPAIASRLLRYLEDDRALTVLSKEPSGFEYRGAQHIALNGEQIQSLMAAVAKQIKAGSKLNEFPSLMKEIVPDNLQGSIAKLFQQVVAAKNTLVILDDQSLSDTGIQEFGQALQGLRKLGLFVPNIICVQAGGNIEGLARMGITHTNHDLADTKALVMIGVDETDYADYQGFKLVLTTNEGPGLADADLVLPRASILESNGTLINVEGRKQNVAQVFPPLAGKPGIEILSLLATKLGLDVEVALPVA